jgi:acetyl esterase/lipase
MKKERIYYGNNEHQFGELRLPVGDGPFPVVIVIHGGFWRTHYSLDIMDDFSDDLTSKGLATWNIEYRRVGHVGGAWPGTFTDVARAVDHLKVVADSHPLDLEKVVTIGHSAGGQLALWVAARHKLPEHCELRTANDPLRLKGAISLAGVCDLALMQEVHHIPELRYGTNNNPSRNLIGGTPEEYPERYAQGSPIELLPIGVPQVLIHGSLDINVPIGISNRYEREAINAGDTVQFIELPTAEHFKVVDPKAKEWPVIVKATMDLIND